jgi:hypothetical protein
VYDEYVRLYLSFFELFFPHPAMTSLAASYWLSLPDEPARLRTLHHYDVLPSQQEPVFDELVRLSAQVFSLPISLIALVDADEVTYKANLGLPGLQQQPRGEAICALVVCQRTPLVFTNLSRPRQLQRLTEMAAVAAQAKSILFYAGAPLHMPTQYPIGSLCVIGYAPRNFGAEEQLLLKQLADIVSELITVRHICLTHEKATQRERWQWLQSLLTEEVQQIRVLVGHLLVQFGTQAPVPLGVLKPVTRRLDDLHLLLQEHHPGPIWYMPAGAVA